MFSFLNKNKLLFSISFLSAAIISFQLALMQILSIIQWHHFAYMIISVALLGFGAAGSLLSIFKDKMLRHDKALMPLFMTGAAIAMSLVTDLSQLPFVRFDSYLVFADNSGKGKLLITYLLFFLPFFLGALAIGLAFVRHTDQIGKIYFANLFGSGVGALIGLSLIWLLLPARLPAHIAILPLLSGFLSLPGNKRSLAHAFVAVAVIIVVWKLIQPPKLILSQYKDLSKTLLLPGAEIKLQKASPFGLMQAVSSPALRYAPGLSLVAEKTATVRVAAFINGDWYGVIADWNRNDTSFVLDFTSLALPYIMASTDNVLVLGSGTGIDVAHALTTGAKRVVAVEPNSVVLHTLKNELAKASDSLYYHPKVSVYNQEPRTFLLMDTSRYDLINLPVIGTFGGSAGLNALQEQFIFTKEALQQMWLKLNSRGMITVTSWMDYPVRNPLKIFATMVEVLNAFGIKEAGKHITAVRSWGTITFVMTRSEITGTQVQNIRGFCDEMMFDPVVLPGLEPGERERYNQFQDDRFFNYVDKLISPDRKGFYEDYDFNIQPATDNKPYFSQFIRLKHLSRLSTFFGNRSLPFFEIGYLIVILTFLQISMVSVILILVPLIKIHDQFKNKLPVFLYFGAIGLAYMFVEIVFIQRFVLYFGNPIYSASAVITSLLIFSGLGSYASNFFLRERRRLIYIFALIVLLLFAYSFFLTPALQQSIHLNLGFKVMVVFLLTAPLAFCMGIPFPAGLSQVSKLNSQALPWAWGINGCLSVISAALATIVSVEFGFAWVMLIAAISYGIPLIVQLQWNTRN